QRHVRALPDPARRHGRRLGLHGCRRGYRPRARAQPADHGRAHALAGRAPGARLRDALRSHSSGSRGRMTFEEARALFPVLERVAYLNAGTFGPLAKPTIDVATEQLRGDLAEGRSGKPRVDAATEERANVRGAIAGLLRAAPENVS